MSPLKVAACVFFSQQPSRLFSVSLPQTQTAARSTSQVNSHSCWLAPTNITLKEMSISLGQRTSQIKNNEAKYPTKRADVVLSCLLPRPALKCMLERASKQAAAWPPGDCPPCCPLRAGSPWQNSPFSLPAPAAAVHARQTLAFTTQPLPLPSYLASLT